MKKILILCAVIMVCLSAYGSETSSIQKVPSWGDLYVSGMVSTQERKANKRALLLKRFAQSLPRWISCKNKSGEIEDPNFWAQFCQAARYEQGHSVLAEFLTSAIDPNPGSAYRYDPLSAACMAGAQDNVLLLLNHGADFNRKFAYSDRKRGIHFEYVTPLFVTLYGAYQDRLGKILSSRRYAIARALLERGADPHAIVGNPLRCSAREYLVESFMLDTIVHSPGSSGKYMRNFTRQLIADLLLPCMHFQRINNHPLI